MKNKTNLGISNDSFIHEDHDGPIVNLFERTYDLDGTYLGVYLGNKKIHLHHSGEGNNFNLSKPEVLEKIVESSWLSSDNIYAKIIHTDKECTDYCMDIYKTYQIYGVKKK
jgi:hypothetical protein